MAEAIILVTITLGVLVATVTALFTRARTWRSRRSRIDDENALKHLYHQRDLGQAPSFSSLVGALHRSDASVMGTLQRLEGEGLLETRGQPFTLTARGEERARQIVRAHRLWERYLADEAGMPLRDVHKAADAREHQLTAEEIERLDAQLGHPAVDPHGDPIPDARGDIEPSHAVALTAWPVGVPARILHVEDEPASAYRQIEAAGLHPGRTIVVRQAEADGLELQIGDESRRIPPLIAGNVFVVPAEAETAAPVPALPLSQLRTGTTAEVIALDPACRGYTRRRLLDLGFTPGTRLTPALDTFAGDPRAYRIRGTLIALRKDQAAHILVKQVA